MEVGPERTGTTPTPPCEFREYGGGLGPSKSIIQPVSELRM